jgi:hypothetical protein
MPAHRDLPPELLARARRGELRRSNTVPGTPERRAADRWAYVERRKRHPELTARQAAGHEGTRDVPPTVTFFAQSTAGPGVLVDVTVSRRHARRVGRYLSLVARLTEGRLSGTAFRARVRFWAPITVLDPPNRGRARFVADPATATALADRERAIDSLVGMTRFIVTAYLGPWRSRSPQR